MKKRIALIATAALCALALCLCAIPALPVFAEDAEPTNVALNKTAFVNNGNSFFNNYDTFDISFLTDGNTANSWHSDISGFTGSTEAAPTILTIDLEGAYEVSCVNIYPSAFANYAAPSMPYAYTVELLVDGEWTVVGEETECFVGNSQNPNFIQNYPATPVIEYALDESVVATKARIVITQDSLIEVDGWTCNGTTIGDVEILGVPAEGFVPPVCVSGGATVIVNNGNSIEAVNDGWSASLLTDGDATTAWHGDFNNFTGSSLSNPTVLLIDLGAAYEISSVKVYPYAGGAYSAAIMPSAYTIEAYVNGAWVEVASDSGVYVANGTNSNPENLTIVEVLNYEFAPVQASQVRMVITADSYCDLGLASCLTVIGEIEVMGVGEAQETLPPAETETETETETTPVVNETETETVVESEVESADESDTETTVETTVETAGETVVEETVAETTATTTAGTDAPAADEGCASVVGFGAVAVLTAAAAAVVLKKKD